MSTIATETRTAAEWVEGFAEGWRSPTDPDSFSDFFARYWTTGFG